MLTGYVETSELPPNAPHSWKPILSEAMSRRGMAIADRLSLPMNSLTRQVLATSPSVSLLAPIRKRRRARLEFWRLGVACIPEPLFFYPAAVEDKDLGLPQDYSDWINAMGPFEFGQLNGYVLSPNALFGVADDLRGLSDTAGQCEEFVPFFDHQTGDYDGWLRSEAVPIARYNHESNALAILPVSSMADWLDLVMRELKLSVELDSGFGDRFDS